MTPLDFIASSDGEAKAAAMTVHNLMTPKWIEITADPITLPKIGRTVIIREDGITDTERFGFRQSLPSGWVWWYKSKALYWNPTCQSIGHTTCEISSPPTHWRPIE
jgi:hypothetical protein